jgi:4-hydroxy-L-threonine phosphate dehydrogenase PdxA
LVERAAVVANVSLPIRVVKSPREVRSDPEVIHVLDRGGPGPEAYRYGEASAKCGEAVLDWLEHGMLLGSSGDIDGLIMAPINTRSLELTGRLTDIDTLQPEGTHLLRMSGPLRVVPLSEHVPLRKAIELVTPEKVAHVVKLVHDHLVRWGVERPRIAVAGINPHAMFPEDMEKIAPGVSYARAKGIDVQGPLVPDAVFRQTIEGRFDVVVTMYHDQGQIAVKTVAFAGACTIYVGLRYVMLSVPHGSAYDIAGKGIAQYKSLQSAFLTSASLAAGRGIPQP